jgi:hypothetical protein
MLLSIVARKIGYDLRNCCLLVRQRPDRFKTNKETVGSLQCRVPQAVESPALAHVKINNNPLDISQAFVSELRGI